VSSEDKVAQEDKKLHFPRREFSYNYLSRSLRIPENATGDKVVARYEIGILHRKIPKKNIVSVKEKRSTEVS
jgi:HSP20 family protein